MGNANCIFNTFIVLIFTSFGKTLFKFLMTQIKFHFKKLDVEKRLQNI